MHRVDVQARRQEGHGPENLRPGLLGSGTRVVCYSVVLQRDHSEHAPLVEEGLESAIVEFPLVVGVERMAESVCQRVAGAWEVYNM